MGPQAVDAAHFLSHRKDVNQAFCPSFYNTLRHPGALALRRASSAGTACFCATGITSWSWKQAGTGCARPAVACATAPSTASAVAGRPPAPSTAALLLRVRCAKTSDLLHVLYDLNCKGSEMLRLPTKMMAGPCRLHVSGALPGADEPGRGRNVCGWQRSGGGSSCCEPG